MRQATISRLERGEEKTLLSTLLDYLSALGLEIIIDKRGRVAAKDLEDIKRFDRKWTKDNRLLRVPQEDCCQALSVPPGRKYESRGGPGIAALLEFLKRSDQPDIDQRLFMKAQIVFWLLAATDGHAKNFSVFLYPGGGFKLTKLYDVMSTQHLFEIGQSRRTQMKHAMAIGNSRHYRIHEIMPRHFIQTATRAGMPAIVVQSILDELAQNNFRG